ncbi:YegP family protein [Kiloniella sp. EL199]|uniref:YegP family protein n=1 Tax=Kiloniella sp. EL199 TaxID=2107581 RepID=UPI0013C52325|nr:YegP family protein [Kiloniella sp. EL199]
MFKITFFLISFLNGEQEMIIGGSETYATYESCKASAEFVAQNSPEGYRTIWECTEVG